MPFSTLLLSVATAGTATLAFAIATPASAQERYAHKHYAHARYRHYAHHREGRQIVVHAQEPAPVQSQGYAWGPVAAVGNVVGGTGQAVQGVFTGAGAIVDDRQILGALASQRLEQLPRQSGITETAQQKSGTIENGRNRFFRCLQSFIDHSPSPYFFVCVTEDCTYQVANYQCLAFGVSSKGGSI